MRVKGLKKLIGFFLFLLLVLNLVGDGLNHVLMGIGIDIEGGFVACVE